MGNLLRHVKVFVARSFDSFELNVTNNISIMFNSSAFFVRRFLRQRAYLRPNTEHAIKASFKFHYLQNLLAEALYVCFSSSMMATTRIIRMETMVLISIC